MADQQQEPFPYERRVIDVLRAYQQAQQGLAQQIRAAIRAGDIRTATQRRQQLARVLEVLTELGAATDPQIRQLVRDAYQQGAERALTQTRALNVSVPDAPASFAGVSREAVKALQDQVLGNLQDARRRIGRSAEDTLARAGRRVTLRSLLGETGSPQAAKRALMDELLADRDVRQAVQRGGAALVDRGGKRWALDTYAEMAVRTTTRTAVVEGSIARMAAHGVNLARVSTHASSCEICRPWEGRLVSLDGTVGDFQGEAATTLGALPNGGPPMHPNCFVADTLISGPHDGAISRPYEGEVVRVHVASGHDFTCTPNHPVLTGRGWVAAGELNKSDDLMRCGDMKAAVSRVGIHPDDECAPARIGEVAAALPVVLREMPVAAEDFHGDGDGSEVHVVHSDGLLRYARQAEVGQPLPKANLVTAHVAGFGLDAARSLLQVLPGVDLPARRRVCAFHASHTGAQLDTGVTQAIQHRAGRTPEFGGNGFGAEAFGVEPHAVGGRGDVFAHSVPHAAASRSDFDTGVNQGGSHAAGLDAESARNLRIRLAGLVEPDRVVNVDRSWLRTHVYNLITPTGWYAAEGLIVHNCRHTLMPVAAGVELLRRELAGAA